LETTTDGKVRATLSFWEVNVSQEQPANDLILALDEAAAHAWPAAETLSLDGWQLRYSAGVTRRANSVWPQRAVTGGELAQNVVQVEQFYTERGLPARYQISPASQPADLDDQLAARGYAAVARTAVQTAELSAILRQTRPLRTQPDFAVEVMEEFDPSWFAAFRRAEPGAATQDGVLIELFQRIQPNRAFALLRIDDEPAAVGMGVLAGAWLGIFCMATVAEFRRRGAASAVLRTLAIWAGLYDATDAYLQVMDENTAAQALYRRVGFQTLYQYHYREQQ
jgi:ribosomal protein S18 acetylase RimI-like enzyme